MWESFSCGLWRHMQRHHYKGKHCGGFPEMMVDSITKQVSCVLGWFIEREKTNKTKTKERNNAIIYFDAI